MELARHQLSVAPKQVWAWYQGIYFRLVETDIELKCNDKSYMKFAVVCCMRICSNRLRWPSAYPSSHSPFIKRYKVPLVWQQHVRCRESCHKKGLDSEQSTFMGLVTDIIGYCNDTEAHESKSWKAEWFDLAWFHILLPKSTATFPKRHTIVCLNRGGCLFPKKTHEQVLENITKLSITEKNKAKTIQKHSKHIPETIRKPSKHYQHPRSLSWNAWWKPSWRRPAALSLVAHLGWRRLRPRCGWRRCCPRRRRRCHSRRSSGGGGPGIAYRALRRGQCQFEDSKMFEI